MKANSEISGRALILAPGLFQSPHAKTAHGLVRGSERFTIAGVLDPLCVGQDAGVLLDGKFRNIPVFGDLAHALDQLDPVDVVIVGVAVAGGAMPPSLRTLLTEAARRGVTVVNGLHDLARDIPEIAAAAAASGARVIDVRAPLPRAELHFWTGTIAQVRPPRVAVLGTDCALGKRTTGRMLVEACRADGIRADMIFTGQTGWMQGGRFGFILDSTPNDFVSGELEHAVVTCAQQAMPEVIFIEGQSALRNPSGPCGAELIVSAQARAVILQHAPGRVDFKGNKGFPIPSVESEIDLIGRYGAQVLAVVLNGEGLSVTGLAKTQAELTERLGIPVICPLAEGVGSLVPLIRALI